MNEARIAPKNPLLLIPARLGSTRLPRKALADIHGLPMVVHVWKRAVESGLGRVVVAAGEREIADAVIGAGGEACLTDPALPTGSDRIYAALQQIDASARHDAVINVQGDVPTLDPALIVASYRVLENPAVDIATLVTPITRAEEITASQVVKAAVEIKPGEKTGRALYFSRLPVPWGEGAHYHHIGLYAYRRAALERFVTSPQSILEKRESLEQLRALALGLRLDAALVDTVPLGVDTPDDLTRARELMKS